MSNTDDIRIPCPYCGEETGIQVELTDTPADYVEDCTVCCRPIQLHVVWDDNSQPTVAATREQE